MPDIREMNQEFERIFFKRMQHNDYTRLNANKRRITLQKFNIGDIVIRNAASIHQRNSAKPQFRFRGPFVIVDSTHDDNTYAIKNLKNGQTLQQVHISDLYKYNGNSQLQIKHMDKHIIS